jgi:pseudouridine synthase, RluA family
MELRCVMARRARLLSALRRELRISDGLVRRLKPLDAFRVNGESAHTDRLLVPGDVVTVRLAEAAPDFPAEDGPLDILWEDECLIAVDKPAGLIVHPTFSRQSGTLANYLLGHYRRTGQACGVHVLTRLDRDTMGVVVFAKSAWAHWLLMEELDRGQVEKVYEALTVGGPEADEGLIDLPIAKCPNPSLLRCVSPEGKPARTRYRVLEQGPVCRLELRPLTGRTHQLRVHCAHEGFPILGDPQYGDGAAEAHCTGQRLVARRVTLTHPLTGERLTFISRIPL